MPAGAGTGAPPVYPAAVVGDAPLLDQPLPRFLETAAETWPDAAALDFLGRRIRYAELAGFVDRAAAGLAALGVGPGVHVGLHLPNTPHYVIAFFATLKCGGVVVNLSPLSAAPELARQLRDAEVQVAVTLDLARLYPVLAAALPGSPVRAVVVGRLDEMLPAGRGLLFRAFGRRHRARLGKSGREIAFATLLANGGAAPAPPADTGAPAVLQFTGGTTGVPKAAVLSHRNVAAATHQSALWCGQAEIGEGEKVVGVLPLFHCYGLGLVLLLGLHFGAEILLYPRFEVDRLMRDLARKRPAAIAGVPTIFDALAAHPRAGKGALSCLRLCLSGGAPLAPAVRERFESLAGCQVLEGYGLTETAAVACCTPMGAGLRPGPVGLPLPGTRVEIRDPERPERRLGAGERGEVCIAGPQVMAGYWKRPDETARAFVGGMLRTGDIGYLDADGQLFLVDRIKDVILSGGFSVYPRMIEEAILAHPAVREVCVAGVPDARRGECAKAFVVLAPGASLTLDELRAFLAPRLGRHEMPQALELRAALPKTPVGKPSRKALLESEGGAG